MSRELFKMNMISSVQKLDNEDIEIIQNYIKTIEQENKQLKEEKKKVWEWVIYKQQHSIEPFISTDELDEILEILGDKEIEEIPLFEGTLEQLNNLSIIGDKE